MKYSSLYTVHCSLPTRVYPHAHTCEGLEPSCFGWHAPVKGREQWHIYANLPTHTSKWLSAMQAVFAYSSIILLIFGCKIHMPTG
jgi:hypothetical protein